MSQVRGPLGDVRVLELGAQGPASFAGMTLAELGADVVRVDRLSSDALFARSPRSDLLNRGKRSILLDLKQAGGVETLLDLAGRTHVLVEGFRPGTAERLGVGPEECFARNPALVYGRVTGYGQTGPLAQRAGHDINYIALTGLLHAIGEAGRPPQVPLNVAGDMSGGTSLVIGILAALREAESTGQGQVVDTALLDSAAHLLAGVHTMLAMGEWVDRRGSNVFDGGAPYYTCYETLDGRYVAVGAVEPRFYRQLVKGLGLEGQLGEQEDRATWPDSRDLFASTFARRTRDDWEAVFADTDACVTPVLTLEEADRHPQVRARLSLVRSEGILQATPSPRFSRTPTTVGSPAPAPGADGTGVPAGWGRLGEWPTPLFNTTVDRAEDSP